MTDFQAEIDENRSDRGDGAVGSTTSAPLNQSRHGSQWGGLLLDPTSVLYVSLFLVLFAFFVVLNVNANEKAGGAEAVMSSLQDAFGGETSALQTRQHSARDLDPVISKVRKTVLTNIPQAVVTMPAGGDVIEVIVPLSGFFVEPTARLAPSRELFLKSLANLASATQNQPFVITVAFPAGDADLMVQRRVAAIAAALGKYGVLPGKLTVVGTDSATEQVRFVMSRG